MQVWFSCFDFFFNFLLQNQSYRNLKDNKIILQSSSSSSTDVSSIQRKFFSYIDKKCSFSVTESDIWLSSAELEA